MYLTDLADVCRKAGLKVSERDGWKTRGHGGFKSIETVVCHHTAGPSSGNMPSIGVVTSGRAGLAGPLCNLGLGRDGTVYVVAAGVAYHAGVVGSTANDNWHAIGIEAEATGTSSWPAVQMDAYAKLCAALIKRYGLDVTDVKGHKEIAVPKGRKIDPNFDMGNFRAKVRSVGATPPKPTAETPYDFLYDAVEGALKQYGPSIQSGYKARRAFVVALTVALKVAPVPAYRKAK